MILLPSISSGACTGSCDERVLFALVIQLAKSFGSGQEVSLIKYCIITNQATKYLCSLNTLHVLNSVNLG
jgi:hypothetical protein